MVKYVYFLLYYFILPYFPGLALLRFLVIKAESEWVPFYRMAKIQPNIAWLFSQVHQISLAIFTSTLNIAWLLSQVPVSIVPMYHAVRIPL